MQRKLCLVLSLLFLWILEGGGARAQAPKVFREAAGNERTSILESLLAALFPGTEVRWAPNIVLHGAGGEDRPVEFAGFTYRGGADGGWEGATGYEVGSGKEEYIFSASRFRSAGDQQFPTPFVVFKAHSDGRISEFRKFILDRSDPVSQIKAFELQEWPSGGWPVVRIQYVSYYQKPESFIAIEWQALFESGEGRITERLPAGIVQKFKDNREEIHIFVVERINPSQLRFVDSASKKTIEYSCVDPCIVDGPRLLQEWASH
jgi:hypothetical protein